MTETQRIADQLKRSFAGKAWHGPAVMELLAGVSAKRATARPIPKAHSIWEIVLHIGAWEKFTLDYLSGAIAAYPQPTREIDWPPVKETTAAAWKKTLETLGSVHERLCKAVSGLADEQLPGGVKGRRYPLYFLLHGIVQHNLYHAGQIALLKKR